MNPVRENINRDLPMIDLLALQSLVRGELVGVYIYKTGPEAKGDQFPLSGPFYYYRGEVKHHHHDGTLTVRFQDCIGEHVQILRFDTTFHAERSGDRYALVPWTKVIERQIKVQKLGNLCRKMGAKGWAYLEEQELDEALTLGNLASARYLNGGKEQHRAIVGTLEAVLSVNPRAVLYAGAWRYEVMLMNKAEGSGALRIYSTKGSFYHQLERSAVAEHLFSSLDDLIKLLAEIGKTFSAVSKDATWCSTHLEGWEQVQ